MDPEELRAFLKKAAITAAFFALGLVFYVLKWRASLVAYVLVVAAIAVASILIQSGRGGGLAASFAGVGGDSLLGARSASPIAKATYVMLGLLLFLCVLIGRLGLPREEGMGLLPTMQEAPAVAPADAAAPPPLQPAEPQQNDQ